MIKKKKDYDLRREKLEEEKRKREGSLFSIFYEQNVKREHKKRC